MKKLLKWVLDPRPRYFKHHTQFDAVYERIHDRQRKFRKVRLLIDKLERATCPEMRYPDDDTWCEYIQACKEGKWG